MFQENLHRTIAARLRTVATLIGKSQSEPLEIDGQAVVPGLGLLNPAIHLNSRADRLERGELRITAAGAVCRGKSTLLNACLGKAVFPVGPEAVTGGICQVVYGGNFDEVTLIEKGASRTMPYADFCEFISLATDEQPPIDSKNPFPLPARLEALDYAVLQSDAPFCAKGIQFVDTLGFNAGPKQELITRQFLEATDAVLIVLRTAPLVDANDVALINSHYYSGGEGVGNMFFAINDFGASDEERRVLMEETAPARLRNFFTGADEAFDRALFDRRVFLVNAKAALDAQRAGVTGDALEATGLPALEHAFHHILDEGEHLRIASEAAVVRTLLPSLDEVHTAIQRQRGRLDANAAAFESAVCKAEARFTKLTRKAHALRTTIESHGQRIAAKAARHFQYNFVMRFIKPAKHAKPPWYADWDSLEFGELLSFKNVAHAAIAKGKRDALAEEMQERLQGYIQQRLEAWGEEVITHLQADIDAFIAETEGEVEDFVLQLDEIQEFIADRRGVSDEFFVGADERRAAKVAQILLVVLIFNPNCQVTGPLLDAGWKSFIVHLVADEIAIIAAYLSLSWPVFFIRLIVEIILGHKGDRRFTMNRVRGKIGKEFTRVFAAKAPGIKAKIQTNLERQFTQLASQCQGVLSNELAAAKQSWDAAAETRRERQATVEKKITQLETIETLLTAQFEAVSMAVYGRVLTSEEQKTLVERFTFSKDEDDA